MSKKNRQSSNQANEERRERISNGTWMGRNAVHKSDIDYDRQKQKQETRRWEENER